MYPIRFLKYILKHLFPYLMVACLSLSMMSWNEVSAIKPDPEKENVSNPALSLYNQLNNSDLKFEVFEYAFNGYIKLISQKELENSKYLTIIDMSMSSNTKRLFIINMDENKIEHQSIVAHGRKSGNEFAKYFSNKINSHQSSIGFYETAEIYYGKHGLSLRLDGLEFSNSNARKRAIVIHSAEYVSTEFIKKFGRLGRSYGCPSLPKEDYKVIIEKIKSGSALFVYSSNGDYLTKSNLVAGL